MLSTQSPILEHISLFSPIVVDKFLVTTSLDERHIILLIISIIIIFEEDNNVTITNSTDVQI